MLRSGDHGRIARWRRAQALARTSRDRPDLIEARGGLTDDERALLAEFGLGPSVTVRAVREPCPSTRAASLEEHSRAMNPTDLVDRSSLRDDIPDFGPGDTLKVHVRVVEGNRERVQVFQGAVIRRQGSASARPSPCAR